MIRKATKAIALALALIALMGIGGIAGAEGEGKTPPVALGGDAPKAGPAPTVVPAPTTMPARPVNNIEPYFSSQDTCTEEPSRPFYKIESYIEKNLGKDAFAGIHFEEDGSLLVLLTKDASAEHKKAIQSLADGDKVAFKTVTHSLRKLIEKQREIADQISSLAGKGIKLQAALDIAANQVRVGILPFNEDNSKAIYKQFGDEMVVVVEGEYMHTLPGPMGDTTGQTAPTGLASGTPGAGNATNVRTESVLQRIIRVIQSWFKGLFK